MDVTAQSQCSCVTDSVRTLIYGALWYCCIYGISSEVVMVEFSPAMRWPHVAAGIGLTMSIVYYGASV